MPCSTNVWDEGTSLDSFKNCHCMRSNGLTGCSVLPSYEAAKLQPLVGKQRAFPGVGGESLLTCDDHCSGVTVPALGSSVLPTLHCYHRQRPGCNPLRSGCACGNPVVPVRSRVMLWSYGSGCCRSVRHVCNTYRDGNWFCHGSWLRSIIMVNMFHKWCHWLGKAQAEQLLELVLILFVLSSTFSSCTPWLVLEAQLHICISSGNWLL